MLFDMFNFCFVDGIFNGVRDILTINPTTGDYKSLWAGVTFIYENIVSPIGVGLLFIYFLVHVISRISSERFSWDQIFLLCGKLVVTVFIIDNGLDIMGQLYGYGVSLINEFADYITGDPSQSFEDLNYGKTALGPAWKEISGGVAWGEDPGLIDTILGVFKLIIPFFGVWVIRIVIQVICYARLIEILVRSALAPLAFADFYSEGLNGAGWKFMKSYFATCLQGLTILIIVSLFGTLAGVIETNSGFFTFSIKYLVIGFSACAAIAKSQSLVKEIIVG